MIARIALVLGLLLAGGCSPHFVAVTTPPVTRAARLDQFEDTLEISPGVAVGFECFSWDWEACQKATASVDDPKIARVAPAYLDDVSKFWHWRGPAPRSAFVIWGVAPGKTVVRVRSENANSEIEVTVVAE
jgi:hypothetical protein